MKQKEASFVRAAACGRHAAGLPAGAGRWQRRAAGFYLAADWNGTLLIAPERVAYTADQTIFEALNASGHSFGRTRKRDADRWQNWKFHPQ